MRNTPYLVFSFLRWKPVFLFIGYSMIHAAHIHIAESLGPPYTNSWYCEWAPVIRHPIFFLPMLVALLPFRIIWEAVFVLLFAFKFVKVVIHLISFFLYRPIPIPEHPTVTAHDVTVIIPTVGVLDDEFQACLLSILDNNPARIIVVTVGREKHKLAKSMCERLSSTINVEVLEKPNKRQQINRGIGRATTKIIILADDHVFWGRQFLASALAPFENPRIGGVSTSKRVIRDNPIKFTWSNFCNFIACIYLERHNFECTATNNIDGGIFVISGRTALYRADILRSPGFAELYLTETWLLGTLGPMNVDDDNCITRYLVNKGWKIHFQNCEEATISTTLGDPKKFYKQCNRWARTTWRSNLTSLCSDFTVWQSQPWCVYAVYLSTFVNFALFYDAALFYSLYRVIENPPDFLEQLELTVPRALCYLSCILFVSKMIKPFPHFCRNPEDIRYILCYIIFGYYHSFIKLWALLTAFNISWGSRPEVDLS